MDSGLWWPLISRSKGPAPVVTTAPVANGSLSDLNLPKDLATTIVDLIQDFSGEQLVFTLAPASAALPDGLSVSSQGILSGVPTEVVSGRSIVVRATNSMGHADTAFTLSVYQLAFVASLSGETANPTHGSVAQSGTALTAAAGSFNGPFPISVAYQWSTQESGPIAGATEQVFAPDGADFDGQTLFCTVTPDPYPAQDTEALVVRYAPPIAVGTLSDKAFDMGTGLQSIDTSAAFSGDHLTFSVDGADAIINSSNGVLSIPTTFPRTGDVVTVTAQNSGGAASQSFTVTIDGAFDVTATFGSLTLEGSGSVPVSGTDIVAGDPSGHWKISGGRISPSASGEAANLSAAPYSLILNDGQTVGLWTIGNSYSVGDVSELQDAFSNHVVEGDSIYLRDGEYNPTGADFRLSRPVALTAPVTIRGHGTGAVIHHLGLVTNSDFATFQNLSFDTRKTGTVDSGCLVWRAPVSNITVSGCSASYSGSLDDFTPSGDLREFIRVGAQTSDNLLVENCNVDGCAQFLQGVKGTDIDIIGYTVTRAKFDGAQINGNSSSLTNFRFNHNTFDDKLDALTATTIVDIRSDGGTGMIIETQDPLPTDAAIENLLIEGASIDGSVLNRQYTHTGDFVRANNNTNLTTGSGSVLITTEDYNALSPVYTTGGTLYYKSAHGDWVQNLGVLNNAEFLGNTFFLGQYMRGFGTVQGGIFDSAGQNHSNVVIAGNVVELTGRNGIAIGSGGASADVHVWSNVVVRRRSYPATNGTTTALIAVACESGGTMYDNVANGYDLAGFTGDLANNDTILEGSAYDTAFGNAPVPADHDFDTPYVRADYAPGSGATAGMGIANYLTTSYTGNRNNPVAITLTPADGATDIAVDANGVATFNLPIVKGTGNILVREGGTTLETIAVGDAAISVSGRALTINRSADYTGGAAASFQIATAAIDAATLGSGSIPAGSYAGIANDTDWNFDIDAGAPSSLFDFTAAPDDTGFRYTLVTTSGVHNYTVNTAGFARSAWDLSAILSDSTAYDLEFTFDNQTATPIDVQMRYATGSTLTSGTIASATITIPASGSITFTHSFTTSASGAHFVGIAQTSSVAGEEFDIDGATASIVAA